MTIELLLVNLLNNWILNARSAALVSLYNYLTPALNLAQPLGQNAHPSAHFPPSYSLCSGHSNQSSSPPEPSSSGLKPELSIPQNPNGLPYGCPDPRRKESEGGGLLTTRSEYLVVVLVSGPLTRAITTYTDRYRCAPGGVKHTLIPLGQR